VELSRDLPVRRFHDVIEELVALIFFGLAER